MDNILSVANHLKLKKQNCNNASLSYNHHVRFLFSWSRENKEKEDYLPLAKG
jgi:hypothetical protein